MVCRRRHIGARDTTIREGESAVINSSYLELHLAPHPAHLTREGSEMMPPLLLFLAVPEAGGKAPEPLPMRSTRCPAAVAPSYIVIAAGCGRLCCCCSCCCCCCWGAHEVADEDPEGAEPRCCSSACWSADWKNGLPPPPPEEGDIADAGRDTPPCC